MAITPKIASASMTAISSQLRPRIFLRNGVTLFRSADFAEYIWKKQEVNLRALEKLSLFASQAARRSLALSMHSAKNFAGKVKLCGAARELHSAGIDCQRL